MTDAPAEGAGRCRRAFCTSGGAAARCGTDGLSESDAVRHAHVLDVAVNVGHAGDIIERSLTDTAARKAKRAHVSEGR